MPIPNGIRTMTTKISVFEYLLFGVYYFTMEFKGDSKRKITKKRLAKMRKEK